jgi:hypothetical protein
MWPFNQMNKQQTLQKAFGKYVPLDVIDKILNDSLTPNGQPEIKHIGFILILVKEDQLFIFKETVIKVLDVINEHEAMIECVVGAFISVLVSTSAESSNATKIRQDIVNNLSTQLGYYLAILHGECDCAIELIGNEKRFSYTAVIPDYKSKLFKLSSLEYGSIEEIL